MVETTGSASIEIEATPGSVYEILSDLTRISDLSPECYRAEWEDGSAGPEAGAKFRGYNRNRDHEWNAGCVVVVADPGKEWTFEVPADDGRATVWRYSIEATEAGCRVTESFDSPILDAEFFQKRKRHDILMVNIAETLQNLKTVAEAGN